MREVVQAQVASCTSLAVMLRLRAVHLRFRTPAAAMSFDRMANDLDKQCASMRRSVKSGNRELLLTVWMAVRATAVLLAALPAPDEPFGDLIDDRLRQLALDIAEFAEEHEREIRG